MAGQIARELVAALADVAGAECMLVSRIGAPIDQPQIIGIRLAMRDGRSPAALAAPAGEIARVRLSRLGALGEQLAAGALDVY